ncbi:Retrovirus-related Pol polyprotein from transposon TNT 1-94 [Cucumis melo var. makuwa]|uniref:Retrovirus-related Pol polyprotein from transposon TNT 1-94 n=1 Tax=Cucumis melo var. makuwa TaxID=1194695 RepID=A0A5A7U6R2_CUCMM|nr:Retrovirus-related Pol polyprotein from transposon TNT 1-94 [Cucumis melo var. makuwa]TYK22211.1 Retrovirus-related Pol polyprotein from transposon TNT 1-94 [Cucumis melo var. makuwa]
MTTTKFEIEKFDGNGDFTLWTKRITAILGSQKALKALEDPKELPATLTKSERETLEEVAYSTLIMNITDNVLRQVIEETTAFATWEKLKSLYEKKDLPNKMFIKEKLFSFKKNQNKNLDENLDEFKKLTNALNQTGEKLGAENEAAILINSIHDTYKEVKTGLKYGRETITVNSVITTLKSKELELKTENKTSNAAEGKNFRRDENRRYRPYGREDFNRNRNHQREDRRRGREHGRDHRPVGNEAFEYTEVLAATNKKAMEIETEEEDLVLDSGCTYHMTSKKNWFVDYKSQEGDSVYMGNNQDCEIIGVGSVLLKLSSNREVLLKGVERQGRVILNSRKVEGLYTVKNVIKPKYALISETEKGNELELWHRRLSHISEKGLTELQKQGLIQTRGVKRLGFCEHCIFGKSKRMKFSKGEHHSKATLDYVHGDLWGPARTHSWGGSRTSMERVRCMISEAKISKTFWAEALTTATYTVNRSPCVSIDMKTPEERWIGATPKLSNLKPFGCTTYVYIKQSKIEPRALKCMFIGYPDGVKDYKLWDFFKERSLISRDVVFKENEIYMESIKVIPAEKNLNEPSTSHQVEIHSNLKNLNPSSSDQLPTEALPSFYSQEEEEEENAEDLTNYSLTRDRGRRTIKPPSRFARADCIVNSSIETIEDKPDSYEDALYKKPHGKIIIPCKWVFKKKMIGDLNDKVKFKARLVAKGFKQKEGVDYNEIFPPVVKHTSIRILLAIVACENLELEQLDVTTAFLHGSLEEEIFMEQPMGRDLTKLKEIKAQLSAEFDMKDLGAAKKILGIEILRDRNNNELSLTQKTYTNKVLCRFNMANSKVVSTPLAQHIKISARGSPKDPTDRQAMSYVPYSNATGSLMYLMVCTRPDLAHSSSLVSRYMGNPDKIHWEATKWVFTYLVGTENRGLLYKPPKDSKLRVRGFVDVDFAGDPDKRRSLTGFAFTLEENLIS